MAFNRVGFYCVVLLFTASCLAFHLEKPCGSPGATGPNCAQKQVSQRNVGTTDVPFSLNYATKDCPNTLSDKFKDFIQIILREDVMNNSRKMIVTIWDENDNANKKTEDNPGVVVKSRRNLTVTVQPSDDRTVVAEKPETAVAAQPTFRSDYKLYPEYGFYKYHAPATWPEARRICNTENAHLPIVDTAAKARMLIDMYHAQPRPTHIKHPEQIHIGMHDLFKEGHFVTIFDEPLENMQFKHWAPGNPSNSNGKEHCGTLRETIDLNDFPCTGLELGFICEKRIMEIH